MLKIEMLLLLVLAACGEAPAATAVPTTPSTTVTAEATPTASGFACGDKTCTADQMCTTASGQGQKQVGAPPTASSTSYSCGALPDECKSNHTCACLHLSASMCSVDKDGNITRPMLMQ